MAGDAILSDDEVRASTCRLETIGRRTGQPRQLPIWFAVRGRTVFLLSGGGDAAHWVRNLRADPRARLRIRRRWLAGTARETAGTPDDALAREAMAAKYDLKRGGPFQTWLDTSLVVAIDLSE